MQSPSTTQPKQKAANRSRNAWREIIKIFEDSNEHPRDFCARLNINVGTLSHWRGVFKKEKVRQANKFIELKIKPDEKTPSHFIIECPTGHKIILPAGVNLDEAQNIFKLLRVISC